MKNIYNRYSEHYWIQRRKRGERWRDYNRPAGQTIGEVMQRLVELRRHHPQSAAWRAYYFRAVHHQVTIHTVVL